MKTKSTTDSSAHCKKKLMDIAYKPFTLKPDMRIISDYDRSPYIRNAFQRMGPMSEIEAIDMMNADQLMGTISEHHAREDKYFLPPAKNAVEDAASLVYKKNAKLTLSPSAMEGSPERFVLKAVKYLEPN